MIPLGIKRYLSELSMVSPELPFTTLLLTHKVPSGRNLPMISWQVSNDFVCELLAHNTRVLRPCNKNGGYRYTMTAVIYFAQKPVYIFFRLATPSKPTSPEPNSHTAPGTGTVVSDTESTKAEPPANDALL